MPVVWAALSGILTGLAWLFKNRIGSWVASALLFFGIAWATNTFAVQPWLDQLEDMAAGIGSTGGDMGAAAVGWFGVLKFDIACTMIASAIAAKFLGDQAKAFLVKRA